MEQTTYVGEGKSFSPFKTEDKHFFGSYFNLAESNIIDVFKELKLRLNLKGSTPKDILTFYLTETISFTDYERFVNMLADYFPIVYFLDNKYEKQGEELKERKKEDRISYFKEHFILLIKAINNLRNYYTHFYHEPIEIDKKVFTFLDNVLLKTALNAKTKYVKTDKTKEILSKTQQEELKRLIELKEEKNKQSALKNGRHYKSKPEETINGIYNDVFKQFLFEDKEGNTNLSERKKTAYSKENEWFAKYAEFELPISSSGGVFLLSLFLNRKEIESFKSYIKGYKGQMNNTEETSLQRNSIINMATHRVYSVLCYKGLKQKIKTSVQDNKETMLMQVVDEISKVPDVIYQNISKEKQDEFIEDWNEYYKDNEENEENLENSKVVHPIIRKRYEDKFNYFALRFLDEYANFPTLRFQIYLGDYIHHTKDKKIGNVITEREIKEKINVFAKLSEVNKSKNDYFKLAEDNDEVDSYWNMFPNPSYNFPKESTEELQDANKIGFYVDLKDDRVKNAINQAKASVNKHKRKDNKPKRETLVAEIISTANEQDKIYIGQATAYLSMNDVHAMIYELLVNKTTGADIEKAIVERLKKQCLEIINKDTSAKILKKYKENKNESIINYVKLYNHLRVDIKANLCLVREHNKRESDFLRTQRELERNKFAKIKDRRNYILKNQEKGNVAVWLANDIKRFMPQSFKVNWKGYQHSELQRTLAFYDVEKQNVISLLSGLNLNGYSFEVKKCFEEETLADFYKLYLENRLNYLYGLKAQFENLSGEPKIQKKVYTDYLKYLKKKNYTQTNLDNQVQQLLTKPIYLERGFLYDKPTMIKGKKVHENPDEFAKWFVDFKNYKEYQNFYNQEKYQINQGTRKDWFTIQKDIKKQQRNDWASLLIMKRIFEDLFNMPLDVELHELFQTMAERIENKNESQKGERKKNFIWNKTIDLQLNEHIKIPDVKLKDIGDFRKYENDARVNTFLSYGDIDNWLAYLPSEWNKEYKEKPLNVIQIQIDSYEHIRSQELFKEIQQFEEKIRDKVSDKDILRRNDNQNFYQYILMGLANDILKKNISEFKVLKDGLEFHKLDFTELNNCDDFEKQMILLIAIRNKFAHNQLPAKEFYTLGQTILAKKESQTYAEYYLELTKQICSLTFQ